MENLKRIMEETHPQKNYFPDIDLNMTSCVLNSKNEKRSSYVCVSERESQNPFSLQPLWMRMDFRKLALNETIFLCMSWWFRG